MNDFAGLQDGNISSFCSEKQGTCNHNAELKFKVTHVKILGLNKLTVVPCCLHWAIMCMHCKRRRHYEPETKLEY